MIRDTSRKSYEIQSKDGRVTAHVEYDPKTGGGTIGIRAERGGARVRNAAAKYVMALPHRTMGAYNISDRMSWMFIGGIGKPVVTRPERILAGGGAS